MTRRKRIATAIAAGCAAGALSALYAHIAATTGQWPPDFDHLWFAAHVLLRGRDPYPLIGPGRAFDWPFGLNYPLPAVVLLTPLGALPLVAARFLFVSVGFSTLTYAAADRAFAPLLLSAAAYHATLRAQWSPLLTAALLIPALRVTYVAKPTIGGALWLSRPSLLPVAVAAALVAFSFLLVPSWLTEWQHALPGTPFVALVLLPGGFILAMALVRWRDPDSRMLAALAIIPQTAVAYESLYLGTLMRTRGQALLWALLTWVAWLLLRSGLPYADHLRNAATLNLWIVYAPTLAIVLFRQRSSIADEIRSDQRPADDDVSLETHAPVGELIDRLHS